MADIDDIMDDIAKELADSNSALNAEMQGRTPENFNLQQELNNIGRELDAIRSGPQAPNPNAPALYENVPVAQLPYSLSVGRMGLGMAQSAAATLQANKAVQQVGLDLNTYAGKVAHAAYTQVAQETLDPKAATAAAEAVADQLAQGQMPNSDVAVGVGREVSAANYSNTYAADMEALGAPKGYAADMAALQGVMAENALGPAPSTIAESLLAEEALGLTESQTTQSEPTQSELSAMSMMANQAAQEAFSSAIAAGETVAEATAAAEQAAQTATQQAAQQIGIDPNSSVVTEAAMNAVNTQAVGVGRLANLTPEQVAAAAQQAVTLGQQGKIGRNTLSELGLLGPLGLAITAPEVEASRAREAQEIMERGILAPARMSPPEPVENPKGSGRGVPLPEPNPLPRSTFGPKESNVLNFPNPELSRAPVEATLLNPAFNVNQATQAYFDPEQTSVMGTTWGQTTPGLEPNIGLSAPQAFGVTGYSGGLNNLNDIGFTNIGATAPNYTDENMAPSRSFMAPQINFDPDELSFNTLAAQNAIDEAMSKYETEVPLAGFAVSSPTTNPAQNAQSLFSTEFGSGVYGLDPDVESLYSTEFGSGVYGLDPDAPPAPAMNPARSAQSLFSTEFGSGVLGLDPLADQAQRAETVSAIHDAARAEQQAQQAQRAETLGAVHAAAVQQNQINAMIDLENNLAKAYGLTAAAPVSTPAPTSSRSSRGSSRSGSRGSSSKGAATSTATRSVVTFGPDGEVTFSQEAADPSDPGPGCYIATDAVSAGAFSKLDKAKAELWCKRALHNYWAGETVRLGYQALSKRAVANGTASKHYDEFQRFVRYGRGLDKTLKGAVTFYTRMAQFFAVGLINRLKAR